MPAQGSAGCRADRRNHDLVEVPGLHPTLDCQGRLEDGRLDRVGGRGNGNPSVDGDRHQIGGGVRQRQDDARIGVLAVRIRHPLPGGPPGQELEEVARYSVAGVYHPTASLLGSGGPRRTQRRNGSLRDLGGRPENIQRTGGGENQEVGLLHRAARPRQIGIRADLNPDAREGDRPQANGNQFGCHAGGRLTAGRHRHAGDVDFVHEDKRTLPARIKVDCPSAIVAPGEGISLGSGAVIKSERDIPTGIRLALVLILLYAFLVGVKALESGIKSFGADFTDSLFEGVANPVAGLFVGILATVLVQSSSVSTATIVGLVGSGTLAVPLAVPMIMGANIGTTVTNTLASLGYLRRSSEFRRAFAGATMHDFFNLLSVAILLPLELATKFLSRGAESLAAFLGREANVRVEAPDSPVKQAVKAPVSFFEDLVEGWGAGDTLLGILLLVLGLVLIFIALAFITRNMKLVMAGRIEASMNALLSKGGGLAAMVIGLLMTVAVQSSSITTSVLVPMIAAGVLTLSNAYPVTLGANVGTTVTALLASLATERPEGLVIALTHTLFNISGILAFYPIPALRKLPLLLAGKLATVAERRKSLVIVYVIGGFVIVPVLGILLLQ